MKESYHETTVAVAKSKEQIEVLLKKFDVQAIRFTSLPSFALLEFIRLEKNGKVTPYRITIKPKLQTSGNIEKELNRAERQVWRVAYWWLKSKLEAIEFGLVEFQQDFLPYMLISNQNGDSAIVSDVLGKHLQGYIALANDSFSGLALPPGQSPPTEAR